MTLRKQASAKRNLKNMHNNYFLQVQTLINQKAIGTGSTRKEESKQAFKKEKKDYDIERIKKRLKKKPESRRGRKTTDRKDL